ncbi:hypothetical protein DFH27DRAFT_614733 [Peziza echinospora]|nr:hypothetical protein DFH27DRAFT_614733 [Peziza echinospora]
MPITSSRRFHGETFTTINTTICRKDITLQCGPGKEQQNTRRSVSRINNTIARTTTLSMSEQRTQLPDAMVGSGVNEAHSQQNLLQEMSQNPHLLPTLFQAVVEGIVGQATRELSQTVQHLESRMHVLEQQLLELSNTGMGSQQPNHEQPSSSLPLSEHPPTQSAPVLSKLCPSLAPVLELDKKLDHLTSQLYKHLPKSTFPQNVKLVLQFRPTVRRDLRGSPDETVIPHSLTTNGTTTELAMLGRSVTFDAAQCSAAEIYQMATEHAYMGEDHVILILGPSGIGKTTLWRQLCEHACKVDPEVVGLDKTFLNKPNYTECLMKHVKTTDTISDTLAMVAKHPATCMYSMRLMTARDARLTIVDIPGAEDENLHRFLAGKLRKSEEYTASDNLAMELSSFWPDYLGSVTIVAFAAPVEDAECHWKLLAHTLNP